MTRLKIIERIGKKFYKSNTENGEFSYSQILKRPIIGNRILDLRFTDSNCDLVILIETKNEIKNSEKEKKQLFNYAKLEREFSKKNIISILASIKNSEIKVWKNNIFCPNEIKIQKFNYYFNLFNETKINNKEKVTKYTYELNNNLHRLGISEKLRSQFVGTCLLSLKNKLIYKNKSTFEILNSIKNILETIMKKSLNSEKIKQKLEILEKDVIDHDHIKKLNNNDLITVLDFIKNKIFPFIDDDSHLGQDILNLFFTTFNKYVGKEDKNQAFTPNHIVEFLCNIANINKYSYILDPTCGSGSFLVQAMAQAINKCTNEEIKKVKKNNIYGIEIERKAFGLATTNMLIHGDGNSNIYYDSCFDIDFKKYISDKINVVLMNPPFNSTKKYLSEKITTKWNKNTKTDPSKGFEFVNFIANKIKNKAILICILPIACTLNSNKIIINQKDILLQNHTLDAVFTLPNDIFHPGTSVNVCAMVIRLNQPHNSENATFFGYYKNDEFIKIKNLGRIDINNKWNNIQKKWLSLFINKDIEPGLSVRHKINYKSEWLAEAYMKTDYSKLTKNDFQKSINNYLSYLIKNNEL